MPRVLNTQQGTAFTHIPGRLRELRSDSDLAFSRNSRWLENCRLNHPRCIAPYENPVLPTRVIDVSFADGKVALFETRGGRGRYMTLSHCWGTSRRLMATTKTFQDLKGGIAVSLLPETFRDAIAITRRLGVRYLWVD
ncbi:HET domain-containing protein, partial [Candidatus Bathyarchaeota archaeon]|nr:HET domain-containing protein [Candidatus Bathyarchaeota archaeon]